MWCLLVLGSMRRRDDWLVDPVTDGVVHVANPTEGVYVFYTKGEEAYIRTDCVVDVSSHW